MLEKSSSIGQAFAQASIVHSNLPAIVAADVSLTYKQLWRVICGFAVSMEAVGVAPNSCVAVDSRDMIACVASMFAASLLGAAYVTLDSNIQNGGVVKPTHFFRSPEVAHIAGLNDHMMDSSWPSAAERQGRYTPNDFKSEPSDNRPWWFTHTSGSTGTPKYISLTASEFLNRCIAMGEDFSAGRTNFCSLFPCNTRVFQVRAVSAFLNGCAIIDTVDLEFMMTHGVQILLGSPHTIIDWLSGRTLVPKIELAQVTGAKLNNHYIPMLLKSFRNLEDVYGSTETSKAYKNIYTVKDGMPSVVGKQLDSEVEIVPVEQDSLNAASESGLVRVRNGYMASSYMTAPDASARVFKAGWFYSGDIGRFGPHGELQVEGRSDELINLAGTKVSPLDVEDIIIRIVGVTHAFVGKDPVQLHPERLVAMVAISDPVSGNRMANEVLQACMENLPSLAVPGLIIAVPTLPKTADGKIMRRECEALLKHTLTTDTFVKVNDATK